MTARPQRRAAPWSLLLAVLLGALCAAWMLYPAWLDGQHVLVGDWRHPDMLSNHWLYCWVAEQLSAGASILHNDRYYHPVGDAPYLAGNGGDAVPYVLMHALLPWPASLTAWLFLTLVLNVVAAYALCRRAGAQLAGSLFGAATIGVSAYLAHELSGGRFSQVPLYGLLGFLWACLGLLRKPSHARAALAGALFAWTSATYWYYGLWAAWMGALLAGAWVLRGGRWRDQLLPACSFSAVALAGTLPPLTLFLRHWGEIPGTAGAPWPHPLALASSLPFSFPLFGGQVERGEVLLSLLALGFAAHALRGVRWRALDWQLLGWLAVAALFYLLALGPRLLWVDGTDTGVPGPFNLAYGLGGGLRRYWWPYRHVLGVAVPLAVLAARGVDLALARLPRWLAPLAALGLALLLPLDLELRGGRAAPAMTWWEPPPAYEALAELEGEVILELPLAPQVVSVQQSLIYQRVHGKGLVNGHAMWVDRVRPPAWDAWVEANSFLRLLAEYERGRLFGPFAFRPEDVLALRQQGLRYLVVNVEYLPRALFGLTERYQLIMGALFGEPVYSFRDHLFVWDMEEYNHQGFVEAPEFRLPADYLLRDGSQMLDLGHNRALGLRGLSRSFPPQLPPEAAPGEGPVERALG